MGEVKLTLRGTAKVREDISEEPSRDNISLYGGQSFIKKDISYEVLVDDPIQFNRLMCKGSAARMAEKCLPDNYFVEPELYDDWDVVADINAVEATEWAENVAQELEDSTVIDILTRWLQTIGSMRVRRALHTELQNEGVDVKNVG